MREARNRAFALLGAVLFLVTSSAVAIAVIWQVTHPDTSATDQSNAQTSMQCPSDAQSTQTDTYPLPDAYKTDSVSKLEKTDVQEGSGQAAKNGDCLVMKYYGTIASSGEVFDENYDKPTPFAFVLGQHQVIAGWDQGLVGMKVGATRRLVIPADLGYGATGACKQYNQKDPSKCDQYAIPPNTSLVFEVKLLKIEKAQQVSTPTSSVQSAQ